ncbi:MAG: hypothetical protein JO154_02275 [Chitinophaga sp.]|uniref:hypothetical protein n=1 Tax=Chitinophaga sp. TaxID=1869181 RepID=UPI0025C10D43|nr:hypothetical protein [Chitinophaga sp.]MBV8251408.1 hypothetical protein [Chitinophaga sp.]
MKTQLFAALLVVSLLASPKKLISQSVSCFDPKPNYSFGIPTVYNIAMSYSTADFRLYIQWHDNPGEVHGGLIPIQVGAQYKLVLYGDYVTSFDMSGGPIQPNVEQEMYFNNGKVKYIWNGVTVTVTCQPSPAGGCPSM